MNEHQRGFTVIEVILFLAMSALLLSSVMVGITANINSTRFLSSTKDMQAYIQKQFSDVQAGLSSRPNNATCPYGSDQPPGASDDCIVIGDLVTVSDDKMMVFPVIAHDKPQASCPAADNKAPADSSQAAKVYSYCPVALGSGTGVYVDEYMYLWSITVPKALAKLADNTIMNFDALAILKSPQTNRTLRYVLSDGHGPASASATYNFVQEDLTSNNVNRGAVICLKSPDIFTRNSHIGLLGGVGSATIKTGDDSYDLPVGLTC